jgi:hypothetical protein
MNTTHVDQAFFFFLDLVSELHAQERDSKKSVYTTLRKARADARLVGVRKKRAEKAAATTTVRSVFIIRFADRERFFFLSLQPTAKTE